MEYYPLRRLPQTAGAFYLRRRVLPVLPAFAMSYAISLAARMVPAWSPWKKALEETSETRADRALDRMQDVFFKEPGLDVLLVRELTRAGWVLARTARLRLWLHAALGLDKEGVATRNLKRIPRLAYDTVMLTGLAVGKSLGYFRGGQVHSVLWWDSDGPVEPLPDGHPQPQVRRFEPPRTLGDLSADIDDLYWASAYGQGIKITSVGEGPNLRWLVSIPGTDHSEPESQANTADVESNMREEVNIPSSMRAGVLHAIHQAMERRGVSAEDRLNQRVLLAGHSQGGIIAAALASEDPADIGFRVTGVLSMGSPSRRHKIRPDVQMLALEHLQDVVPAMDGTPRMIADQRVVVQRSLTKPRIGSLYYAHSSSTYTDTLRQVERRAQVTRWGRQSQVVAALREYLPGEGEPTRVTHHYVWQDIVDSHASTAWSEFLELNRREWQPVTYGDELAISAEIVPTPQELLAGVTEAIASAKRGGGSSGTGEPPVTGEPLVTDGPPDDAGVGATDE